MKAREILGEFSDSLFDLLEIEPRICANGALKRCDEYLKVMRNTDFSNQSLSALEKLERHIQLVTTSKELLEKALLEEDKKRNEVLVRIRALLGNQG